MSKRTISVDQLRVGMYLVGVDRSWFRTPFLRHRFSITDRSQIDALRKAGIATVTIDLTQGRDAGGRPEVQTSQEADAPPSVSAPASMTFALGSLGSAQPEYSRPSPLTLANHLGEAKQRRIEWMRRIGNLFEETRARDVVAIEEVRAIVDDMVDRVLQQEAACLAVLGLRQSDPTLQEHGMTACTLAVVLGRAMGLAQESFSRLGMGALLHDIGLARLPRNIIKRPKTMAPAQQALYRAHSQQGVKALEKSGSVDAEVLAVVRDHHAFEPDAPAGAATAPASEFTKIVAVVDQYDELVTGQTGLPPMSSNQALTQLYQRYQAQADWLPVVSSLIRTIGVYPLYSLVALNSGELGVVGAITPGKAHLPLLYLCRDRSRRPLVPPLSIDLVQEQENGRTIQQVCDAGETGVDVEQVLRQVAA